MKKLILAAIAIPAFAFAQNADPEATPESPNDVIEAAGAEGWRPIEAENLLVMTLGNGAQIFIELAPDFAPVHVENMRTLARAGWYDGNSVYRVQDNYVVQWGDATEEKALPEDVVGEPPAEYDFNLSRAEPETFRTVQRHHYTSRSGYMNGWPVGVGNNEDPRIERQDRFAFRTLVHCYGMIGVARGNNPDTGTGAELYTVIGHAPRHLDRNIALVGRVVEGIEHLSSLPRGTGTLGFYETEEERTPIESVRLASELPAAERPRFEVMRTDGEIFRRYVHARANRSGWFVRAARAVDVCNVNLPIRRVAG